MHIHAEHNGVRFDCNVCFKQFKRKGSLDRHVAGVHKKVKAKNPNLGRVAHHDLLTRVKPNISPATLNIQDF